MYRIRKLFRLEVAHVLDNAFSKPCEQSIHGHSYKIEVFLDSITPLDNGMVLDFGRLKGMFDAFDHCLFLPESKKNWIDNQHCDGCKGVYVIPGNPTAEWMASFFFGMVDQLLILNGWDKSFGVSITGLRVHETETGWAEYVR